MVGSYADPLARLAAPAHVPTCLAVTPPHLPAGCLRCVPSCCAPPCWRCWPRPPRPTSSSPSGRARGPGPSRPSAHVSGAGWTGVCLCTRLSELASLFLAAHFHCAPLFPLQPLSKSWCAPRLHLIGAQECWNPMRNAHVSWSRCATPLVLFPNPLICSAGRQQRRRLQRCSLHLGGRWQRQREREHCVRSRAMPCSAAAAPVRLAGGCGTLRMPCTVREAFAKPSCPAHRCSDAAPCPPLHVLSLQIVSNPNIGGLAWFLTGNTDNSVSL